MSVNSDESVKVASEQEENEPVGREAGEESQATAVQEPEEKGSDLDLDSLDLPEYSSEEFSEQMQMYEETLKDIVEGEIVTGTVIKVTESEVVVTIGFKSEGVIAANEFSNLSEIKPGDSIEVLLENIENQDGLVVLSKQKADFMKVWDKIKDIHDSQDIIQGRLVRRIKGGVVVDLLGVDAFLPGSQIALRQIPDIDSLIGQTLPFRIIKINKRRRNIVVSRRVVLEEERQRKKKELIKELEEGQVREGVVKNITDFGAFIDLGGIDGLLHITDMSWGRISHPSEMVAIGDEVKVKVLNFDPERERISLSMKDLTPDPWNDVDKKYPVGSRLRGKVVSITDYGAFVELERGVEGLIHISEMSWTRHIRHPSKVLAIGDVIEAMVLNIDKDNHKVSLGLKQVDPDPWESLAEKYPKGTRVSGRVRNLTSFGAFVEIEDGIDGLVHVSDLSWTRRVMQPGEVLRKGDKVEVMILNIDKDARRISLSLKHCQNDPWPALAEQFPVGNQVEGPIVRMIDKGVIVEIAPEVEGFVPQSQLGRDDTQKPDRELRAGDVLPLEVIEFDSQNRRIVLSVNAYFSGKTREEIRETWKRLLGEREEVEAPPDEPEQPEAAAPRNEPEQLEAEAPPDEPERPETEGAPDEPERPEAEGAPDEPEQPEAEAPPDEPEQPEAEAPPDEPERPQAALKPEEPSDQTEVEETETDEAGGEDSEPDEEAAEEDDADPDKDSD